MMRGILSAAALAAVLAVGCDDSNEVKAPTDAKENAAEKAADNASKKLESIQDAGDGAVNKVEDKAETMKDNMVNKVTDANSAIDDLMDKAKTAVGNKRFDEAETYVKQVKPLMDKLPTEKQSQIKSAMDAVQKMIDEGKKAMKPS